MKLVVLSDIHDNVWRLQAALQKVRELNPDAMLVCGDLCSPFIVKLLMDEAAGYRGPIHLVFGNNDGDRAGIARSAAGSLPSGQSRFQIHGELAELVVTQDERGAGVLLARKAFEDAQRTGAIGSNAPAYHIGVNHYDYLARTLARSGSYQAVFYGHNHEARWERCGETVVINPGAVMGFHGSKLVDIPSTFALFDTDSQAAQWFEILPRLSAGDEKQHRVSEFNQVAFEKMQ